MTRQEFEDAVHAIHRIYLLDWWPSCTFEWDLDVEDFEDMRARICLPADPWGLAWEIPLGFDDHGNLAIVIDDVGYLYPDGLGVYQYLTNAAIVRLRDVSERARERRHQAHTCDIPGCAVCDPTDGL